MKDLHTDASEGIFPVRVIKKLTSNHSPDFPRTADGRVYHLGLKAGEVANRIVCSNLPSARVCIDRSQVAVGHPSRALIIEGHLDKTPVPFKLTSERGFVTITGRYKGVPVSIVSTGMGFPNTDFFVREVRECLTGDMIVVRLSELLCICSHDCSC